MKSVLRASNLLAGQRSLSTRRLTRTPLRWMARVGWRPLPTAFRPACFPAVGRKCWSRRAVKNPPRCDRALGAAAWSAWLEPLRQQWAASIDPQTLAWHQRPKLHAGSSLHAAVDRAGRRRFVRAGNCGAGPWETVACSTFARASCCAPFRWRTARPSPIRPARWAASIGQRDGLIEVSHCQLPVPGRRLAGAVHRFAGRLGPAGL